MGTISAMIIICCLIISAALTVVIILVTIPTEIIHYPELWISRESTHHGTSATNHFYFHPNKNTSENLRNDRLHNSVVGKSSTIASNAITTTKTATATTTFPNTAEISKLTSENNELLYRSIVSSTAVPLKTWKPNHRRSSQRRTTVFLSTNITITREKKVTSSNRRSATELRHPFVVQESTPRTLRQNSVTLMLHQHIEQLPLNDDSLMKNRGEKEQATQMTLLREVMFPNDVKIVGLAMQREVLYVATNDGRITVINPETNEQV